jgi:signal transduction histidine kinase
MNWNKIRFYLLILLGIVTGLQLPATIYVDGKLIIDLMSIARILQFTLAVVLIIASFKKPNRNFLSIFLNFSILVQVFATIKYESPSELVAYNFIAILVIISAITFSDTFKKWSVVNFPIYLFSLIFPIFYKAPILYASIGIFISNFLFGIFSLIVSLVAVAIFSTHEYITSKLTAELLEQEKRLKEEYENIQKQKLQLEIGDLALQVAHDIRSPLAALESIMNTFISTSSDGEIAKDSLKRINGIANTLLEKGRSKHRHQEVIEIHKLVQLIIQSKKFEYPKRNIVFKSDSSDAKVFVNELMFENVLSNFINNAFEASNETDDVIIHLESVGKMVQLTVADKGIGISTELLQKLGKEKISLNKDSGNGVGIYLAVQTINQWGGNVQINSELNKGTTFVITLPNFKNIINNEAVVLLDNDELVRITWEHCAKKNNVNLQTYSSAEVFMKSICTFNKDTALYIDSDLGDIKGEEIAKKLNEEGFLNISITSGHPSENFKQYSFLKTIISKSPPF